MIPGQLAWCGRERLPGTASERVGAAIDAPFRTDLDLKTSGGDRYCALSNGKLVTPPSADNSAVA